MRRFFLTILFMAACAPAIAAEAPVKTEAALPSTGMTLNDCLLILQGLNAIDEHIVLFGKPGEQQTIKLAYEYGSGTFRAALGSNIRILTTLQQGAQADQQKILLEVFKGKGGTPPDKDASSEEKAEFAKQSIAYDKQLKELTAAPCAVQLTRIKVSDLKLEKNELPASALANLDKILDK